MNCTKRGLHLESECDQERPVSRNDANEKRKPKKLLSGLLNTRERDTPTTQRAIMHHNSARSPFLRLPSEIRNRIYNLVFGRRRLDIGYTPHEHKYMHIDKQRYRTHFGGGFYNCRSGRREERTLRLGLLRVCRQTYGEAALLPYALNTFIFENTWVMKRCMKTLRPTQKRTMGTFYVRASNGRQYAGGEHGGEFAGEYYFEGSKLVFVDRNEDLGRTLKVVFDESTKG